jgi:hypothetical protein
MQYINRDLGSATIAKLKAKPPLNFRSTGVFKFGGKGEIRTHGTPKGTLDFESSAFDHSATFPGLPTRNNEAAGLLLSQIQAGRCLGEKDYRTAEYDFQAPRQKNFKEARLSVA